MGEWDETIRTVSKWLSDNAPVCRGFSGVEPWARGDSPVSLMVVKRAKKEKVGSDVPTLVSSGEQGSDRSESGSKQVRSAFGCDACKKRKIKCDEGRPTCTNCCASMRKRARRCVYAYDFIARPSHRETPSRDTVERGESAPRTVSRNTSVTGEAHSDAAARPFKAEVQDTASRIVKSPIPAGASNAGRLAADGNITSGPHAKIVSRAVDADALSHLVDAHGLTWFINATEVVEKQVLSSNQIRAFTEYRQAVLERCWNAYINYHGKLPLSLPSTPATSPDAVLLTSAMTSMIALPGLTSTSPSVVEGTTVTPEQLADLTQSALLHAFVSVGATHYAYWAARRGESADEHHRGGAALIQLSTNALLQVLRLQDRVSRGEIAMTPTDSDDWEEEIQAKLLITLCMQVTYRIIAADPLGPANLRLECDWVAGRGGPAAMIKGGNPTPAQMELIPAVLNDAIYALERGESSFLPPDSAWLDSIPIARRLVPEAYGISLEMAKYILDTVSILYGPPMPDRSARLQALHRTLTTSLLVDIYASAHPARVQTGDMLYRQALICLVCLDGLGLAPDDKQLVAASDAILELFAEAVYGDIYTVRWTLPLLIGGGLAQKLSPEQEKRGERDRRAEAGRIFDAMADTCGCADIEAARLVTEKVWERRDSGRGWRLRETMREENLDLFLV